MGVFTWVKNHMWVKRPQKNPDRVENPVRVE